MRQGPSPPAFRPSWRLLCLGVCLVLAGAGLALGEAVLLASALPLGAWLILGGRRDAPSLELEAERVLERALALPGRPLEMSCVVHNRGPGIDCLLLRDVLPRGLTLLEGSCEWRGSLAAGASARISYTFTGGRGRWRFEALVARAIDPFSSLEGLKVFSLPALAVIQVEPGRGEALALAARAVKSFSGQSRVRRQGGGSEFAGTRDYSPGDPLRSLNWRAEARYGHSVVNLFEEEKALDVGIILDARAQAYGEEACFEAALSRALALGLGLLEGGNRVGFLAYGSVVEWTAPGMGREQKLRLRRAAAGASLGDHAVFERFDNLPLSLFPPRSSILLVSPLLQADLIPLGSLAARGYKVSVFRVAAAGKTGGSPEADLAEAFLSLEAGLLEARLAASGIELIEGGAARWA